MGNTSGVQTVCSSSNGTDFMYAAPKNYYLFLTANKPKNRAEPKYEVGSSDKYPTPPTEHFLNACMKLLREFNAHWFIK